MRHVVRFGVSFALYSSLALVDGQAVPQLIGQYVCAGTLLKAHPTGTGPEAIAEAQKHDRLIQASIRITDAFTTGLWFDIKVEGDAAVYYVRTAQPATFATAQPGPCSASKGEDTSKTRTTTSARGAATSTSQPLDRPPSPAGDALAEALKAQIKPEYSPKQLATVFWNTVLKECRRPEESSPSKFYSWSTTTSIGSPYPETFVDWKIEEYQGPFTYTEPVVTAPSPAEQRNSGLEWSATATFNATVSRNIAVHLRNEVARNQINLPYSYKSLWSRWFDRGVVEQGVPQGTMTVTFRKDRSGITFDHRDWKSITCETAMAPDPFSMYAVSIR